MENVSVTVNQNDKIALIGPNGAGKTTLLNLISGKLIPDSGEINHSPYFKVGYLKQNNDILNGGTIENEMQDALKEVYAQKKELQKLSEDLSRVLNHESEEFKNLEKAYQSAEEKFISLDGYNADVKINTVLTGMGFAAFDKSTPVDRMSGGEQTRLMLCKLLLEQLDILILDEATNHLDFVMLAWLEDYLKSYKGTVITVSHDRWFLNNVTNITWELEGLKIVSYPASYNDYLTLKKMRLERLEKEYEKYQNTVISLQDYADKNMARASTSQSAKSRLRMIEHLDKAENPPKVERPPKFDFQYGIKPVSDILDIQNLDIAVDNDGVDKLLIKNFCLHIKRGEKIAIIGNNGTGKSTLLKIITGFIPHDKGTIEWGRNVKIGYFHQDGGELNGEKTILMELWDRYPRSNELNLRNILALVGFRGEEAYKTVDSLSGGETARLKLAILMEEKANVLILDEPTNHLDIPSKEALEEALRSFDGTLIVVSHDRWLLSHLTDKIVYLKDTDYTVYDMNFTELSEKILSKHEEQISKKKEPSKNSGYRSKAERSESTALKNRQAELERKIEEQENMQLLLQEKLTIPENMTDYKKISDITDELAAAEKRLETLYDELDEVFAKL
ncbi:MAG: ABC-F family ATP-binding cassette domain-containing protein [Oscillospiraceae bacterium]